MQDEIFLDRFRFTIGGRVDKFGNLSDPVFSPRLAAMFKPVTDHALRVSFNRAFRSPSVINNYLDISIVNADGPERARAAAAAAAAAAGRAAVSARRARPSAADCRSARTPQDELTEESLTAYEVAYTGTFGGRTTLGAAFYVNDLDNNINFVAAAEQRSTPTPRPIRRPAGRCRRRF